MSDIKVLSTTAMKTSLDVLTPQFEQATGHKVSFSYGPSARIAKQVADGEANDVAIVTDQAVDDLIKQGQIVPGTRADIAQLGDGARGAAGRTEARHFLAGEIQADDAGGPIARHEQSGRRRPERRQPHQHFRPARHCRADEAEAHLTARAGRPG